ncbi:MAG: hypothetical protein ACK47B_28945 [Armatimonadota bacterium]
MPYHRRALLSAAAAAAVLLATGSAAQQPKKYTLKELVAAGDVSTNESVMAVSMDVTLSGSGLDLPPIRYASREREKYTETILAADSKGPSALRRVYSIARVQETNEAGQPETRVLGRQGKTVTVRRSGGKTTVTVARGTLAAEERDELKGALEDSGFHFFPPRALAVGEEWAVDPKAAQRLFQGATKAELTGRLVGIKPFAGRQCAHVAITLDLEAAEEGAPGPLKAQLTGDLYHALDLQRTLSARLRGPAGMTGTIDEDGVKGELNGQGTMELSWTSSWQKVAGKPVPAKK